MPLPSEEDLQGQQLKKLREVLETFEREITVSWQRKFYFLVTPQFETLPSHLLEYFSEHIIPQMGQTLKHFDANNKDQLLSLNAYSSVVLDLDQSLELTNYRYDHSLGEIRLTFTTYTWTTFDLGHFTRLLRYAARETLEKKAEDMPDEAGSMDNLNDMKAFLKSGVVIPVILRKLLAMRKKSSLEIRVQMDPIILNCTRDLDRKDLDQINGTEGALSSVLKEIFYGDEVSDEMKAQALNDLGRKDDGQTRPIPLVEIGFELLAHPTHRSLVLGPLKLMAGLDEKVSRPKWFFELCSQDPLLVERIFLILTQELRTFEERVIFMAASFDILEDSFAPKMIHFLDKANPEILEEWIEIFLYNRSFKSFRMSSSSFQQDLYVLFWKFFSHQGKHHLGALALLVDLDQDRSHKLYPALKKDPSQRLSPLEMIHLLKTYPQPFFKMGHYEDYFYLAAQTESTLRELLPILGHPFPHGPGQVRSQKELLFNQLAEAISLDLISVFESEIDCLVKAGNVDVDLQAVDRIFKRRIAQKTKEEKTEIEKIQKEAQSKREEGPTLEGKLQVFIQSIVDMRRPQAEVIMSFRDMLGLGLDPKNSLPVILEQAHEVISLFPLQESLLVFALGQEFLLSSVMVKQKSFYTERLRSCLETFSDKEKSLGWYWAFRFLVDPGKKTYADFGDFYSYTYQPLDEIRARLKKDLEELSSSASPADQKFIQAFLS